MLVDAIIDHFDYSKQQSEWALSVYEETRESHPPGERTVKIRNFGRNVEDYVMLRITGTNCIAIFLDSSASPQPYLNERPSVSVDLADPNSFDVLEEFLVSHLKCRLNPRVQVDA